MSEHLFWVDCEMTGLDPETCSIIEIASIVTDNALNIVAEGPNIVIHQSEGVMEKMDQWNQDHHRKSGLYDAVLRSQVTMQVAEEQTLQFAKQHLVQRKSPLCGNSIWQDRRFLCRYMPKLETYLHYRNIDVSSFKEVVRRWYPKPPGAVSGLTDRDRGKQADPPGNGRGDKPSAVAVTDFDSGPSADRAGRGRGGRGLGSDNDTGARADPFGEGRRRPTKR